MRYYIIIILIMFCWLHNNTGNAQTILNLADSLEVESNWYKEYPIGWNFKSSFIPFPIYNFNNKNFYKYLENQEIDVDKFLKLFDTSIGIRFRKTIINVKVQYSLTESNEAYIANSQQNVYWEQSFYNHTLSVGQIVLDKSSWTIIANTGIGLSRLNFQYYYFNSNNNFDFENSIEQVVTASPALKHRNVTFEASISFLRGYKKKKKFSAHEGITLGYRNGFSSSDFESEGIQTVNPISDRISQVYITGIFGFSINKKRK